MTREIEIKVRVSDSTKFVEFLTAEAEFLGEAHQVDEYFTPPDRDFTAARPVNEWLRLRTTDKGSSINYKYWHRDDRGISQYADEHESSIGSPETLRGILSALKFRSLCTVDKIRKTWRYNDYEIALDHEKTLGDFVEVELIGETTEAVPKVRAGMLAFLRAHGITDPDADQVGYPYLLLFGDKQ